MEEIAPKYNNFKIITIVLLVLVAGNLVLINKKLFLDKTETLTNVPPVNQQRESSSIPTKEVLQTCEKDCQEKISFEVAKVVAGLPTTKPQETTKTITVRETSKSGTTYIPLNGSYSTVSTSWVDVPSSQVYIKIDDYGKSPYTSFEASLKTNHQNGKSSARIFDVTNNIAVDGSELSTSSQSFEVVSSGNLPFWRGNNLYKIQIKSLDGQEVYFSSARVKIVSQ